MLLSDKTFFDSIKKWHKQAKMTIWPHFTNHFDQ